MEDRFFYTVDLQEIDQTKAALAGGKGANLGELSRISGLSVPAGFCITTEVFKKLFENNTVLAPLLDKLAKLNANNRKEIGVISEQIRGVIAVTSIPQHIENEIQNHIQKLGETNAFAVRSSATAEDLPTASFAGQQDTYLNITGKKEILRHVRKCWASLFTDRAVAYRMQQGFDHRKVYLAVIIQKMIIPEVAGILFTADPVTANRKIVSIDASFGLGEALVSGIVNADNYKVREGTIIARKIGIKKRGIYASEAGGTTEQELSADRQQMQSLPDGKIIELESIGRKIEAHFGQPQDIEWCLSGDAFHMVQSRPITTLFPVPEVGDSENHVYVSVGHQQMMTDAMKPLGLSFFLLTTRAPMRTAGGRLFVDVTNMLATAAGRKGLIENFQKSDPLTADALLSLMRRGDFVADLPGSEPLKHIHAGEMDLPPAAASTHIVAELIGENAAFVSRLKQEIGTKSGLELFDFIQENMGRLKEMLFDPKHLGPIFTGINAATWINEKMMEWLGEKNAADVLSQSVTGNITSEMGMELLDVADVIRPYPEVITFLQTTKNEDFLNGLAHFKGGKESQDALEAYLDKYGMRCAGEIDITKPRWLERPATLIPLILTNIKNFAPGERERKFEKGRLEAVKKEEEILEKLSQQPGGAQKVEETKRTIRLMRDFAGYREYPKYGLVSVYFLYKMALISEGEKLQSAGLIGDREDIYYLTFDELREAVREGTLDRRVIDQRKEAFRFFEKLSPPRVMTSDGEVITGTYDREDLPEGAIAGLAVSSGTIEGRARVILKMEDADIADGDILVTAFTDPSWTPLFVSVKGLVTEVGGLMTHGAVIAREYGLPAVVGVENATKLIQDGQRIRLNGTDGFVELL